MFNSLLFTNKKLLSIIAFVITITIFRVTIIHSFVLFNIGNITINNLVHPSYLFQSRENHAFPTTLFEEAISLNTSNSNGWRSYGYALLLNDEEKEAINAWSQSSGMPYELAFYSEKSFEEEHYAQALNWTKLGLKVAPEYGDWFYYQGLLLMNNQEIDAAISILEKEVDLPLMTLGRSDFYFQLGILNQLKYPTNLANTLEIFDKAIELEDFSKPQNRINSHFERGEIYRKQGNWNKAILDYQWVLDNQPTHYWTHIALGTFYWQVQPDIARSEKFFLDAIALRPDLKRAFERLGQLYSEQGKLVDAIEVYQSLLFIDPEDQSVIEQIQVLTNR